MVNWKPGNLTRYRY